MSRLYQLKRAVRKFSGPGACGTVGKPGPEAIGIFSTGGKRGHLEAFDKRGTLIRWSRPGITGDARDGARAADVNLL